MIYVIPVVSAIFVIVGIVGIILQIMLKKRCNESVDAEVVDIVVRNDSDGSSTCSPVFGYEYGGTYYKRRTRFFSTSSRFSVGDHVTLFIDPNKPERFYCPKETIGRVIFYLIFMVVGVLTLCWFIKSYKDF
jgi:hypothetical protein